MVTRKPLPKNAVLSPKLSPYLNMQANQAATSTPAHPKEADPTQQTEAVDSDTESWERYTDSEDESDIPAAHAEERKGRPPAPRGRPDAAADTPNGDPGVIRPAMTGDSDRIMSSTPDSTLSGAGIEFAETNPFRRKMSLSSAHSNAPIPPMPTEPPPLPLSDSLSKLSLNNESSKNPWQPALDVQKPLASADPSDVADQVPTQNIWDSQVPSRAPSTGPASRPPAEPVLALEEKAGWSDTPPPEKSAIAVPPSFRVSLEGQELEEDTHAWDNVASLDKGKAPMTQPPVPSALAEHSREEPCNLIDNEPTPGASKNPPQLIALNDEKTPGLPPRVEEKAPATPGRAPISAKTETYQVKNVNWSDPSSTTNARKSPILVQNVNGPCPLMALVNALTLTTPASAEDAVLVNTLRTREQISLDLLLDAVFDELMSERRITSDQYLPDITELYDFLKGLHTGMNVNPRFIPTEETERAFKRTSLTHLHPSERGDLIPGTFEDTKEMTFYRIFQIPLIHGWLPPRSEPVYEALKRQAETYEDAQNILFREEEFEDKLSNQSGEGLSEEEQGIYQDVLTIKSFLHSSATQLTSWGLQVITKAMRPGSVAILFRNDHFSTLYRHPHTLQIFALVTDAGYAGHAEIVWESLVDVNGERSEFFSGDFRPVGGPAPDDLYAASGSASASNGHGGGWTTVQNKKGKSKEQPSGSGAVLSPKEQEDRDLALALQLQEEEEQRHAEEQAQRRRESQLSEQFIEQQASRRGPVGLRSDSNNGPQSPTTGRRPVTNTPTRDGTAAAAAAAAAPAPSNGAGRGGAARPGMQQVRSLVPPVVRSRGVNRPSDADDEDAPPSYETAAKERPYIPPAGHPSHPESNPTVSSSTPTPMSGNSRLPASRMPGMLGAPQSPMVQGPTGFRRAPPYRQGVPPAAAGGSGNSREKDCVVM